MKLYKMYIRYIALWPLWLLAKVINIPLAPIVVLFAQDSYPSYLPRWLWWFQTPLNPIDGDRAWQNGRRPFKYEEDAFERWWNRTNWLWRNSMYGFRISVLGQDMQPDDALKLNATAENVSDNNAVAGKEVRYLIRDGKRVAFQYYLVKPWWPKARRCLRINIGWKLWNYGEDKYSHYNYVFTINPFTGFGH